jgi:hypothetical protein
MIKGKEGLKMLVLGLTGVIDSILESFGMAHTGLRRDAFAVLMKDGKLIAEIEIERLNKMQPGRHSADDVRAITAGPFRRRPAIGR